MIPTTSNCGNWRVYGSSDPKILIAGHSHTFAMFMAVNQESVSNIDFAVVTHADFRNQLQLDKSYWNFVTEISKKKKLALSWNGNQHNLLFLLDAEWNFNAIGLSLGKNYPFVTVQRIKALFNNTFDELEQVLVNFDSSTEICLLGTPPPKPLTFLKKYLDKDDFFMQQAKSFGLNQKKLKISSDQIRLYMWKVNQELIENMAKRFGLGFIPSPNEAIQENGLLDEKFSSDDLTHANPEYGRLMLNKISDFYEATNA